MNTESARSKYIDCRNRTVPRFTNGARTEDWQQLVVNSNSAPAGTTNDPDPDRANTPPPSNSVRPANTITSSGAV